LATILEEPKMVSVVARMESDVEQIEQILRDVSEVGRDMKDELNSLERFFALTDEPVYGKSSPLGGNERWKQALKFEARESAGASKTLPASVPDSSIPVTEPSAPFIMPSLPSDGRAEVTVAVDPRVLRLSGPKPRSLVRRIAERLVLGVAALALFGVWVWMAGQTPSTNTSPLRGTNASPETVALPEPDAAITNPESKSLMPAWFSPQILYSPAMAPSATTPPRTEVPESPRR
jgi:hypothetical protein